MKQSFEYNGLTIEVREETGKDILANPHFNRKVLDYVAGQEMAPLSAVSELEWHYICQYVEYLQTSTVTGKGLQLPSIDGTKEEVGKGYKTWMDYIDKHPECLRQWMRVKSAVNRQTSDPQPPSAETTSTSE